MERVGKCGYEVPELLGEGSTAAGFTAKTTTRATSSPSAPAFCNALECCRTHFCQAFLEVLANRLALDREYLNGLVAGTRRPQATQALTQQVGQQQPCRHAQTVIAPSRYEPGKP